LISLILESARRKKGKQEMPSKKDIRELCRKEFGSKWFDCHPLIKKARIAFVQNKDVDPRMCVHVREGGKHYRV